LMSSARAALVVEGEAPIRRALTTALRAQSYDVIEASLVASPLS